MFGKKRRRGQDFFKESARERRASEDDQPWFLGDDENPALDIEAGRSAWTDPPETDS